MPNENHEIYNSVDISTYTDTITDQNVMTPDFIDGCTLSAGLLPCDNPRVQVTENKPFQAGANSFSPFYFNGSDLWFDETELSDATNSSLHYLHVVYAGVSENTIANSLKIENYRNFVTITPHTETINGTPYTYYELGITTKYGSGDAWTNSVLKPMYVISENDMRTGVFIEELMCVQQCDFGSGNTYGRVCTELNYQQGRRNLVNGSGTFIEKAIWYAGLALEAGYHIEGGHQYGQNFDHHLQWQNNPSGFYAGSVINNIDDLLMVAAIAGLKFEYNNTLYKPIVENGVVTGYTDDMTKTSEWDNWRDIGDHAIPTTPPTPQEDAKDNEIDVAMAAFSPSIGFVNYIEMDYATALKVAAAFNTYNASIWNIGGDLFKNLISYKIFAVYGTHSGTIKNIHIAGHELEYEGNPINGNYIDDMGTVDLGTIIVGSKFKFNDWRDYAPYTKIECFVPCCGWCQLPPWVMGRAVTGTMYIDLTNGSCKAVIKAGKTPVAEIGGCCAVDIPFSSVATGAKAAGIISSIANGAVAAFNPTPQNLISGSFGIMSAFNANFTETKGTMGDGSNINGCTQFLIKVTRPASTDTGNGEITTRYKHEKGIPCSKTKTLASGQGFTQIMDANIDGTMTDREKQMIVDGFRHGLIL